MTWQRLAGLLGLGWASWALMIGSAAAKETPLRVIPWNGYKAALSLTYDDGDPIHLDVAVPEMAKRGLRGTFFLIAKEPMRFAEWGPVAAAGQEIGNHSWSHRHVAELKPEEEKTEVTDARAKLEGVVKKPVLTFAYPFVEISPGLRKWVEANAIVARGGGAADNYLTPDQTPDWMNIPSQATMSAFAFETYKDWVDQDLSRGAWTVLMIHAIEGSNWYQPVPKDIYLKLLDYLAANKSSLWVAPFGEVGAYWRAQKILESSEAKRDGKKTTLRWTKPTPFPQGVTLQVKVVGTGVRVLQGGKALKAVAEGTYALSFDAQEVTLFNATWVESPVSTGTASRPPEKAPVLLPAAAVPAKEVLLVDDFEGSAPSFGASWWEGCDSNGVTKLLSMPFAPVAGGSPKTPGHCATLKGTLGPLQAPWPWAVLSLGLSGDGKPVDLSAYGAVRFYAKGDGKVHALALNKASVTDYCDFQADFTSPKDWTLVTVPFTAFSQASWGKPLEKRFNDVTKLTFMPGTSGPDFEFQIDDVEFIASETGTVAKP